MMNNNNVNEMNNGGEMREVREVSAMIHKVTGEGVVRIGDAIFTASRDRKSVGDLVMIVNGDVTYQDDYKNGEIYRITDIGDEYGANTILINKKWKEDPESDIMLFDEEYTVLEPDNFQAFLLSVTMSSGETKDAKEGKDPEEVEEIEETESNDEDDIPEHCEGCPLYDDCWGSKDNDDEEEDEYQEEEYDFDEDYEDDENEEYEDSSCDCDNCPHKDYCEGNESGEGEGYTTQEYLISKAEGTLEHYSNIFEFKGEAAVAEFTEADDAVTIAMIKRHEDGKVLGMGYSQCNPDDEFHEVVGKVIALFRASGEEPPHELIYLASYPKR